MKVKKKEKEKEKEEERKRRRGGGGGEEKEEGCQDLGTGPMVRSPEYVGPPAVCVARSFSFSRCVHMSGFPGAQAQPGDTS